MTRRTTGARSLLLESWLEFREIIEEHPEVRDMLYDPVTGLPTTPLLFPRIETLLQERGEVSFLCVDIDRLSDPAHTHGQHAFDDIMQNVARVLEGIAGSVLRDADILAELMVAGEAFVIVLSPPRERVHIDADSRQMVAERVQDGIRSRLAEVMDPTLLRTFGCYVGASTVVFDGETPIERLVADGLDVALADAATREEVDFARRVAEFETILEERALHVLVQPVFELGSMRVIGYEALSRGPEGSACEYPDALFYLAYGADLVMRLERVCRTKAIEAAAGLPPGMLLFVNVEPDAAAHPEMRGVMTAAIAKQAGVSPASLVLEISERGAMDGCAGVRSRLEYLRALGFGIGIDDAGAGYTSLRCVADARPDWIKIDMSIVRDCDNDDVRRRLIGALVAQAQAIGAKVVAQGIESPKELAVLRELGVGYGQGFLFSTPVLPFPEQSSFEALAGL